MMEIKRFSALIALAVGLSGTMRAQTSGTIAITAGTAISMPVTHKQSAEPLTPDEKKELSAAREKADRAQKELEAVEDRVKAAHGQRLSGYCDPSETVVTFWGDWALVDTKALPGCVLW
jgi:hypothetical protein